MFESGVALRALDIDISYIYRYGFPAWRGGPMFYADTIGLPNVLMRIQQLERTHGSDLWSPAPLLKRLVSEDQTFAALDKHKESIAGA
jgi:3-hydroxyacyl-CoA dehydrogenase